MQPCATAPLTLELAPGLVLQRFRAQVASPVNVGDGCITIARADPSHYRFVLLTALANKGTQRADEWRERFHLTGVMNASMFQENSRSVGLMVSGKNVNNLADATKYGAFMAWDPVSKSSDPVAFFGRTCQGFNLASVRRRYGSIVQNYRLLDCDGSAIVWKDEKVYSATAIGQDRSGRVAFIHSRTPFTMTQFAAILATPALDLRAAMFVEGGPEASLSLRSGETEIRATGSYETGFTENDDNQRFWSLPNVIGFAPK